MVNQAVDEEKPSRTSDDAALPPPRWKGLWAKIKHHPLARLGPGLITGVADDDPSGIATYSQAGAQFGLNMLWTMPLTFPLMVTIQLMCAQIGRVTGKGLAANIKTAFPASVLRIVVLLVLIANTLNIAADVAAMGEVAELVTGLNRHVMTALFVIATLGLQILVPYHVYVNYLKWLTLSLLAYAAVLFTVHVPLGAVAARTVWPQLAITRESTMLVVGVFGTTISPYLFFWQASEEVEDMRGAPSLLANPHAARRELRRLRWDTWSGMFYSNISAYFIILATAVTLFVSGIHDINTAAEAATALKPVAGNFAFMLFALGILGVGMIGVPVLAGSAGYALCEAMGWNWGLERKSTDARGFYGVIAVSVLAGLAIQYSPISPMKALVWSAVINGVVAVPLTAIITILAARRSVMGDFTFKLPYLVLGWLTTVIMGLATIGMFVL